MDIADILTIAPVYYDKATSSSPFFHVKSLDKEVLCLTLRAVLENIPPFFEMDQIVISVWRLDPEAQVSPTEMLLIDNETIKMKNWELVMVPYSKSSQEIVLDMSVFVPLKERPYFINNYNGETNNFWDLSTAQQALWLLEEESPTRASIALVSLYYNIYGGMSGLMEKGFKQCLYYKGDGILIVFDGESNAIKDAMLDQTCKMVYVRSSKYKDILKVNYTLNKSHRGWELWTKVDKYYLYSQLSPAPKSTPRKRPVKRLTFQSPDSDSDEFDIPEYAIPFEVPDLTN